MNLVRGYKAGNLSHAAFILGIPIIVFGYLLDVLINWTLFSLLAFSFPLELTITQHMNRLLHTGNNYQKRVSYIICHNLLDFADPSGSHCQDLEPGDIMLWSTIKAKLLGSLHSRTMWFNAFMASLLPLLDYAQGQLPMLQAFVPAKLYGLSYTLLVAGNLFIRFFLTVKPVEKLAEPPKEKASDAG